MTPRKENSDRTTTNITFDDVDSNDALICSMESKLKARVSKSKASLHATLSRELLVNYVSGNLYKVYLGDD